ncbi:MAG: Flp pilus assembly protein CpaB [Anaerolineales bacterium]|nr:Flp pilus assembly protein CpaB [Anaerolineales bacterium]
MSRRRGIILVLAGIVFAIIGIFVITSLIQRATTPLPQPTPLPPRTEPVVVTTHDIPLRALLDAEDLVVVDVLVELVPQNAIASIEDAVGRITKIPLVTGEMVMEHHLANPTNINKDMAFIIEDDQVLMAFPATDLMSQINILQPGDIVDILASVEQPILVSQAGNVELTGETQETEDVLFTFSALQRVTISAVIVEILPARGTGTTTASASSTSLTSADATPEPTPTPQPSQIEPQAVLVALSPQDALVLKHIKDAGGIVDIVLRAPTSVQIYGLSPVMSEYLKDRYELVITR